MAVRLWPALRQLSLVFAVLGTPFVLVAVLVPILEHHDARRHQAGLAMQAEEAAAARLPFERAFTSDVPLARLAFCRQAIEASFPYWQPVVALHAGRDRIDAYVRRSLRVDSLHRVSCRDSGIVEQRVEHPLAASLLARQAAEVEAPAEGATAESSPPEMWAALQRMLAALAGDPTLVSIELLHTPWHEAPLQRVIRQVGGQAVVDMQPADVPAFASLSSADAPPTGLAVREPTRWTAAIELAFALLERTLPAEARIVEARIGDDQLRVLLRGPLPGLDAAVGMVDIDAWGEITTWLYPLDGGGFECARGVSLAELRGRFEAACAGVPGCRPGVHLAVASYSCAGGLSSGRWALQLQPR